MHEEEEKDRKNFDRGSYKKNNHKGYEPIVSMWFVLAATGLLLVTNYSKIQEIFTKEDNTTTDYMLAVLPLFPMIIKYLLDPPSSHQYVNSIPVAAEMRRENLMDNCVKLLRKAASVHVEVGLLETDIYVSQNAKTLSDAIQKQSKKIAHIKEELESDPKSSLLIFPRSNEPVADAAKEISKLSYALDNLSIAAKERLKLQHKIQALHQDSDAFFVEAFAMLKKYNHSAQDRAAVFDRIIDFFVRIADLKAELVTWCHRLPKPHIKDEDWLSLGKLNDKILNIKYTLKSHFEKSLVTNLHLEKQIAQLKKEAADFVSEKDYHLKATPAAVLNQLHVFLNSPINSTAYVSTAQDYFINLSRAFSLLRAATKRLQSDLSALDYEKIKEDIEQHKSFIINGSADARIFLNARLGVPTEVKRFKNNRSAHPPQLSKGLPSTLLTASFLREEKKNQPPLMQTAGLPKRSAQIASSSASMSSRSMGAGGSIPTGTFWKDSKYTGHQAQPKPSGANLTEIAEKAEWLYGLLEKSGRILNEVQHFYASAAIMFYLAESLKNCVSSNRIRELRNSLAGYLHCLVGMTAPQLQQSASEFVTMIVMTAKDNTNGQTSFETPKTKALIQLMDRRSLDSLFKDCLPADEITHLPFETDLALLDAEITDVSANSRVLLELINCFRHSQKQLREDLNSDLTPPTLYHFIKREGDKMRHDKAFELVCELHNLWLQDLWATLEIAPRNT